MSLSPESAEHGVEVLQSLPASAGALGSVLSESALLTPAPSMVVSTFLQKKGHLSPFWGIFPGVFSVIGMCFCPVFTGIMQNRHGKSRQMDVCMSLIQTCASRHLYAKKP